jgi:aconitate hydratase
MSIPEAAQRYQREGVPLVVLAGRDYGMGSSRDWAAKGQAALGVRAVLAEGYERIHRTNLVGCGVLPLQFRAGEGWRRLGLSGEETFVIAWDRALPGELVPVHAHRPDGRVTSFAAHCRIDSPLELEWYRQGGVVALSLRRLLGIQPSKTGVGTDLTQQRSARWGER